ncbi:MAG: ribosome biogenesis GTPase Der, partial [Leptospiraceae bacterium]|nr:ribosome biogenesis GTPase Der [Leptospiraceae bacterium]
MAKKLPVIGLAGRRNAGKSSLFNALLGKNRALTHETPGLTRDVLRGEVNRYGVRFTILDLPGLDLEAENGLDEAILKGARASLDSVDLLIYLMEPPAAAPFDLDFINWLRKENRPVIIVVNKIDAPEKESDLYPFYEDGLNPFPVSAASRFHLKDLCAAIREDLEGRGIHVPPQIDTFPHSRKQKTSGQDEGSENDAEFESETARIAPAEYAEWPESEADSDEEESDDESEGMEVIYVREPSGQRRQGRGGSREEFLEEAADEWRQRYRSKENRSTAISDDRISDLRITLVGKQNAGKSSLFNRLVNEELSLVSDVAGTTRDTLDTLFRYHGRTVRMIDTAGLKKRGAVRQAADFYSMRRTLRAMQDSEVIIHIVDGLKGFSDYDKKIQAMIGRFARPCIIVINKWDAVPDKDNKTQKNYLLDLKADFRFLENVPVLFISAVTGKNTLNILKEAFALKERSGFRVTTSQLNGKIKSWFSDWPGKNAGFRVLYATQPDANPPVFLFFVNDKSKMQKGFPR